MSHFLIVVAATARILTHARALGPMGLALDARALGPWALPWDVVSDEQVQTQFFLCTRFFNSLCLRWSKCLFYYVF